MGAGKFLVNFVIRNFLFLLHRLQAWPGIHDDRTEKCCGSGGGGLKKGLSRRQSQELFALNSMHLQLVHGWKG